jgi:hypothetical protein
MSLRPATIVVALLCATASGPAGGSERSRLTLAARRKIQRRKLEMLVLKCRVKLAEREKSVPAAALHLGKAETSGDWFASRKRLETDAGEREKLGKFHISSAVLLANSYQQLCARAVDAKLVETAQELRGARRKHLRILRKSKWVRETIQGKLWLAGEFAAHGEYGEARRDYRELLARYDADGNGHDTPDEKLASFATLRSALHRTRGLRAADYAAARGSLGEIDLCLRGGSAEKRKSCVERDYARGHKLLAAFLKKYPGFGLSRDGKRGAAHKALLAIKAEMLLRLRLFAARSGLVAICVELARAEQCAGRSGTAARHYAEGLKQVSLALEYRPRDADLLLHRAECLLGTGEPAKAFRVYRELRAGSREGGSLWWTATRGVFAALEAEGKLRTARSVLVLALRGYPREIDKKWPEARKHATRLAAKMGMGWKKFIGK